MRRATLLTIALVLAACSSDPDRPGDNQSTPDAGTNQSTEDTSPDPDASTNQPDPDASANQPDPEPTTIAGRHPGDQGIATDPAVVWHEPFDQATIADLAARYDQARTDGMTFSDDTPPHSTSPRSVIMAAGGSHGAATDLYTRLPGDGYDHIYVRYYVKHEDAPYHHSGMWIGGYNPPTAWPSPGAGSRPNGSDRFSVAVEPVGSTPTGRRMDFYNYWMAMRSWMAEPSGQGAYYGNALLHDDSFEMALDQWMCIELMVRLNSDSSGSSGAELAVWYDDSLVRHFTDEGPLGYWVRDKFCTPDADSTACTNFAPEDREQEILDLQWRTTTDLRINHIWPQNYISSGSGALQFSDIVVATERIGCIVPD